MCFLVRGSSQKRLSVQCRLPGTTGVGACVCERESERKRDSERE